MLGGGTYVLVLIVAMKMGTFGYMPQFDSIEFNNNRTCQEARKSINEAFKTSDKLIRIKSVCVKQ